MAQNEIVEFHFNGQTSGDLVFQMPGFGSLGESLSNPLASWQAAFDVRYDDALLTSTGDGFTVDFRGAEGGQNLPAFAILIDTTGVVTIETLQDGHGEPKFPGAGTFVSTGLKGELAAAGMTGELAKGHA